MNTSQPPATVENEVQTGRATPGTSVGDHARHPGSVRVSPRGAGTSLDDEIRDLSDRPLLDVLASPSGPVTFQAQRLDDGTFELVITDVGSGFRG